MMGVSEPGEGRWRIDSFLARILVVIFNAGRGT
jgi:hypothetical protein